MAPDGEESPVGDHLDADELNAYAENSLPDQARAFYSDHLADCERCRKLVTQLTQASGAVAVQRESLPENKSIATTFLARVSSLLKVRYAVPTLAALAILVVAVVVIRREPRAEFVAQLNSNSQVASPAAQDSEQAPTSQGASEISKQGRITETDQHNKSADTARSGGTGETRSEKPTDAVAVNSPRELSKLEEKERPTKMADEPSVAAAPAPAAPPKTISNDRNAVPSSEVAQKKNEPADKASAGEDQRTRDAQRKKPDAEATAAAPAREVGEAATANRSFGRLRSGNEKAKDDDETRSVVGRSFRRDGNRWIDTAYESGAATINVRRGSEQYRALVADEPGIGTIADRLDGEVIVVWKGRAYRIR